MENLDEAQIHAMANWSLLFLFDSSAVIAACVVLLLGWALRWWGPQRGDKHYRLPYWPDQRRGEAFRVESADRRYQGE